MAKSLLDRIGDLITSLSDILTGCLAAGAILLLFLKCYLFLSNRNGFSLLLERDVLITCAVAILLPFLFFFYVWRRSQSSAESLPKRDPIPKPLQKRYMLPTVSEDIQKRYMLTDDGFVCPAQKEALPAKFAIWEDLASQLYFLNLKGTLADKIDAMPLLSIEPDELDLPALRRARVILTYLVVSLVHGHKVPWQHVNVNARQLWAYAPQEDGQPRKNGSRQQEPPPADGEDNQPTTLPVQLATPWRQVSELLGMPLVLVATDFDILNSYLPPQCGGQHDPRDDPSCWVDEFQQLITLTNTRTERGFHAVPHACNRALAPLVGWLIDSPDLVESYYDSRDDSLVKLCAAIESGLVEARNQLENIYTNVDVAEFYDFYRFLLGGWPKAGLVLPASPAHNLPPHTVKGFEGPSAGQTAVFILIDLVLGVKHGPKLSGFQKEQRGYMPSSHTRLLADVEERLAKHGNLNGAATEADAPDELKQAYSKACKALSALRAYHLGFATHYLKAALKGTGGSDFRSLLDEGLVSTREAARVAGCSGL